MQWETVIGLEIHVQLTTDSKLFSGSSTAFGAAPNTQVCAFDMAIPGTLPVLNQQAVHYAVRFGLAVNAAINQRSVFDRKHYFYPDLPKGYQTTQLHHPIVGAGQVAIDTSAGVKSIRIHHAHLEEDAGKSVHDAFPGQTGIDLNRAGMPLIEIVSEPDMRSAEEAIAFAKTIHRTVMAIGICDGEMSQGSLRFDVNVSVRPQGETRYGTRTEVKNLNSFRFMQQAIDFEVSRQIDWLEQGMNLKQETRLYNPEQNETRPMRSKEQANDYRYFPCPDLLPVVLDEQTIAAIRADLPELPGIQQQRFITDYGLSDQQAALLTANKPLADYFVATYQACNDAGMVADWLLGEMSAYLNKEQKAIEQSPINPQQLGGLLLRIQDKTLSQSLAKQVFAVMWQGEGEADTIIAARGLQQVSDPAALETLVDKIVAQYPEQVAQYRAADKKKRKRLLGGLMGPIMSASQGQANPREVSQILLRKLEAPL